MKENELMVGDWVYGCTDPYSPDEEQKKFPVKVIRIDIDGDIYTMGKSPSDDPYDYEWWNIEPIPITPEILEKNGFVRVERGEICTCYRWREKSDKIYGRLVDIHLYKEPIQGVFTLIEIETCSNKGDGLNRFHSCDTDYVHELQHALRLCGIEKEIVL